MERCFAFLLALWHILPSLAFKQPGLLLMPRRLNKHCIVSHRFVLKADGPSDTAACRLQGGAACCNCLFFGDTVERQTRAETEWASVPRSRGRLPRVPAPEPIHIDWHNLDIFEAAQMVEGSATNDARMSFWVVCVNVLSVEDYTTLQPRRFWGRPDEVAALPRFTHAIRIKCDQFEKVQPRTLPTRRQWTPIKSDGTTSISWLDEPDVHDAACVPVTPAEWAEHEKNWYAVNRRKSSLRPSDSGFAIERNSKKTRLLAKTHVSIAAGSSTTCLDFPQLQLSARSDETLNDENQSENLQQSAEIVMTSHLLPPATNIDIDAIDYAIEELHALPSTPWVIDPDLDYASDTHWYGQDTSTMVQNMRLIAKSNIGPSHMSNVLAATAGPASSLTFSNASWPSLFSPRDVRGPNRVPQTQSPIASGLSTCVTSGSLMPDMELYNQLLEILGPSDD